MAKRHLGMDWSDASKSNINSGRLRWWLLPTPILILALAVVWYAFLRDGAEKTDSPEETASAVDPDMPVIKPIVNAAMPEIPEDEASDEDNTNNGNTEPQAQEAPAASSQSEEQATSPSEQLSKPGEVTPAQQEALTQAEEYLKIGDYRKIRDLILQNFTQDDLWNGSPQGDKAAELLTKANKSILFTDLPDPEHKITHVVVPGDTLDALAKANRTTIEAIQIGNNLNLNSSNIRIGQKLRIYTGTWKIIVSKNRNRLILFDNDKPFVVLPVGVGRQDRTPVGDFVISAKVKEPSWYAPDGKVIPYGEPENILGTRWLNLEPAGDTDKTLTGFGIHGTWDEGDITRPLSNGCIRMRNSDIEELYHILPHQVPVSIQD